MEHMEDVEMFISEGGALHVAPHHSLRSLLRRLKGSERHRVFGWLNCNFLPLDKVHNITENLRPADDVFIRFLRAFFFITLSVGVMKLLYEQWMISSIPSTYNSAPVYYPDSYSYADMLDRMWLEYPFVWSGSKLLLILIAVAIVAAAIVAAAIVKKKMKSTDLTAPRKEEVYFVSGLIQQV